MFATWFNPQLMQLKQLLTLFSLILLTLVGGRVFAESLEVHGECLGLTKSGLCHFNHEHYGIDWCRDDGQSRPIWDASVTRVPLIILSRIILTNEHRFYYI